jgi:uncharacterized damage-inducible protein DinB
MESLVRPIVAQYTLSNGILATAVKDLTGRDAMTRSRNGEGPSIAWTVGHLCHFKTQTLGLLGRPTDNPFAAQFEKTPATDGQEYPPLTELMASWASLHAELSAALGAASAQQLESPMPGAGPHEEKRILDTVLFFAWHEAYHIGAIGAIRKELGRKAISELVTGA